MLKHQFDSEHFKDDGTCCQLRTDCPFAAAHSRLQESHRHFHDAERSYSDPDAFRSYLNSCIQSLRNVTFVLQSQKALILDFENWYSPWQEQMRRDRILKWIVEARNQIVKQGDLETTSVAKVAILDDYDAPPSFQFPFPPFETTESLSCNLIDRFDLPMHVRKNGILRVERRWVVADLPNIELLHAISHAYSVIAFVIADAHKPLETRITPSTLPEHLPGQMLACMRTVDESRVNFSRLSDKHSIRLRTRSVLPSESDREESRDRYGKPTVETITATDTKDLRYFCEFFFRQARTVMATDGYHCPFVFLMSDKKAEIVTLAARDRSDKLVMWRALAAKVEKLKAHSVIVINEMWVAHVDPSFPCRPATDSPNREEVLGLDGVSSNGEHFSFRARIYRTKDGTVLGDTQDDSDGAVLHYLEPVREVWRAMFARADIAPKRPPQANEPTIDDHTDRPSS